MNRLETELRLMNEDRKKGTVEYYYERRVKKLNIITKIIF